MPGEVAEEGRHQPGHPASGQRVGGSAFAAAFRGGVRDQPLHDRLVDERERPVIGADQQRA
jgi:hypothetical protein